MLLTGLTIRWSWEIRLKTTYFNEGADIRISIHFLALLGVIGFAIGHFISPLSEPNEVGKFLCISLVTLACCWILLYVLLWPKVFIHYFRKEINNKVQGLYRPAGEKELGILQELRMMWPSAFRMSKRYIRSDKGKKGAYRRGVKKRRKVIPTDAAIVQQHDDVSEVQPVSLSHRTPEMYVLMEKKYYNVKKVNEQLIKICEEHRINPETGEMEEDFVHALDVLERRQIEEINAMDGMYREKYKKLKQEFHEKHREARRTHATELEDAKQAGVAGREKITTVAVDAVVDMKRAKLELETSSRYTCFEST